MERASVLEHLTTALGEGWSVRGSDREAILGHGGRGILLVEDTPGGARVTVRGAGERRKDELVETVASPADLPKLAPLVEAAKWWATRLSPTSLVQGRKYFVRKPFVDRYDAKVPAGETLTFTRTDLQRYDRCYTILFLERRVYVREDSDVLADFDLFFEAV
ncbi:MAG: hypothetical protein ACOZNI_34625 [Myxococcota bacterium]